MGRRMRMLASAGMAAMLSVAAAATGAQGAEGPPEDFRISGPGATAREWSPAMAWNYSNDQYLVVWWDWRNEPTRGTEIYGQLVSSSGSLIGSNFCISGPNGTAYALDPAVVWNDTAREYLVVWEDARNDATRGTDVYGQRVSATGSLIESDFRVTGPGATNDERNLAVAWDRTANEYLVVWEDLRNSSTRSVDIYAQRLGADGERLGSDTRISGPGATDVEFSPAVAWNGVANEYLIVWEDGRDFDTRGGDLYGQRVSASLARIGSNFRLSGPAATENDFEPAVAWNGWADEYLVVWGDARREATRGADVYGQRVSPTGALLGSNFRVAGSDAAGEDRAPAVVWNDTTRQYLVVWEDGRSKPTRGTDIYGQRVTAAGARIGPDFQVSGPGATADESDPALAWDDTANRYFVVYEDERNSATRDTDIYGQRVAG